MLAGPELKFVNVPQGGEAAQGQNGRVLLQLILVNKSNRINFFCFRPCKMP